MAHDIFEAIRAGDKERVGQLIVEDADAAHRRNPAGVSALMQARYESRMEIVELLRASAPALDIFEAAALGDVSRLQALLHSSPTLATTFSSDGATALQFACFFGQLQAAEELVRGGADVNVAAKNTMRVTALHSAAASRNAEIVKLILRNGADPNAKQQSGYTALHSAAFHNDAEMARALLDAGADPEIRSDEGKTAADMAREKGFEDLAGLLTSARKQSADRA